MNKFNFTVPRTDPAVDHDESAQAGDAEWQRIWFASLAQPWTSMAIVPSEQGVDVIPIAEMLGSVGRRHGVAVIHVVNAVKASIGDVQTLIGQIAVARTQRELTIVALNCPSENPATIPLARATSGVLLVVRTGESRVNSVKKTVDAIGRDRILGSIVLD